jgi:hypothetical protein
VIQIQYLSAPILDDRQFSFPRNVIVEAVFERPELLETLSIAIRIISNVAQ